VFYGKRKTTADGRGQANVINALFYLSSLSLSLSLSSLSSLFLSLSPLSLSFSLALSLFQLLLALIFTIPCLSRRERKKTIPFFSEAAEEKGGERRRKMACYKTRQSKATSVQLQGGSRKVKLNSTSGESIN
jgi:hypothetical protein